MKVLGLDLVSGQELRVLQARTEVLFTMVDHARGRIQHCTATNEMLEDPIARLIVYAKLTRMQEQVTQPGT